MAKRKMAEDEISLYDIEPDELDRAIADLPSGESFITIYRVRPQGQGHPLFVASYTPEEFSLEMIQQNHGGGKYNLWAKRGHEVIKKMRVEIEGEPKTGTVPVGNAYLRRVNAQGKPVFLTKREAEQEETTTIVKAGGDPLMILLIQEIKSLKDAIGGGGAPSGGFSRKDFLEELITYKQLFSSNPVGDQSNMIATILQKGLEIGARAANGDVGGNSWVDTIRELIPVAQQALTSLASKQAIEQSTRIHQPPQTVDMLREVNAAVNNPLKNNNIGDILPNMTVKQQPSQASGFAAIAPMLAAYIPLILPLAARDQDPSSVIDIIDNNISEEQKPHIIGWLNSPSWFKDLCTLDPRIQLQSAWWNDLHDALLGQLTGVPGDLIPGNPEDDGTTH